MAITINPFHDPYNDNLRGMDRMYREKLENEMYYREQQMRREMEQRYSQPVPSFPKEPELNKNLLLCN